MVARCQMRRGNDKFKSRATESTSRPASDEKTLGMLPAPTNQDMVRKAKRMGSLKRKDRSPFSCHLPTWPSCHRAWSWTL